MVAAGQAIASTAWGAAVGAAMIATGTVMSKVGTVAEMLQKPQLTQQKAIW